MQKAQDSGYIGMAGVEPEFIAMKYDENGQPVKAIDTDPIKELDQDVRLLDMMLSTH
jgi:glutamine synthetase